jgi:hypothetical protein
LRLHQVSRTAPVQNREIQLRARRRKSRHIVPLHTHGKSRLLLYVRIGRQLARKQPSQLPKKILVTVGSVIIGTANDSRFAMVIRTCSNRRQQKLNVKALQSPSEIIASMSSRITRWDRSSSCASTQRKFCGSRLAARYPPPSTARPCEDRSRSACPPAGHPAGYQRGLPRHQLIVHTFTSDSTASPRSPSPIRPPSRPE